MRESTHPGNGSRTAGPMMAGRTIQSGTDPFSFCSICTVGWSDNRQIDLYI